MNERLTGPEIQALALIRFPEVYVAEKMYLWTDEQTVEWVYVTFPRSNGGGRICLWTTSDSGQSFRLPAKHWKM
jgi:hypothetical protein